MKKILITLTIILCVYNAQSANDSTKASFYFAFDALKNMLEGKDSLNYEKAVFITENAYYNNAYDYKDFKNTIDFHIKMVNILAENARKENQDKFNSLKTYQKKMYMLNTSNWAIFKYITDTTFYIHDGLPYYKNPFTYTYDDPYGSTNWENTQVLHLFTNEKQQGNCYALATLFKIFSDRLKSDARLTVAPHHIYIQNRDSKGDFYNVELASKSFPPDGSIQTLTYTTDKEIMNGMAERTLNDKETIALNFIYLAKGFQHKYNDNTNDFLINCAELAYKYDTLSLNALLLKAEVTENRLLKECQANNLTTITVIRANKMINDLLVNYEEQLNNLYTLGYREIPKEIEDMILAKIQHGTNGSFIANKTPNPFNDINEKQRYATLSWGMFDEFHQNVDTTQYFHALFNTETKKIIEFLSKDTTNSYKVDPVVFAMSVDPLFQKFPFYSPYQFAGDKPIIAIDLDGLEELMKINWYSDANGSYVGSTFIHVEEQDRVHDKVGSMVVFNRYKPSNDIDGVKLAGNDLTPFIKRDHGNNVFVGDASQFKYYDNGTSNSKDQQEQTELRMPIHNKRMDSQGSNQFSFQFKESDRYIVPIDNPSNNNQKVDLISFAINNPDYQFDITGYVSAENSKGPEANHQLALDRAETIKKTMVAAGIDPGRIKTHDGGVPATGSPEEQRKATVDYTIPKSEGQGGDH